MNADKITPNLHISDARVVYDLPETEHPYDEIITLGYGSILGKSCPEPSTTGERYVFPDGPHQYSTFRSATDYGLECLKNGDTTLVHCYRGASRSGSVCAAILAIHKNIGIEEAKAEIKSVRPQVDPEPRVWESAVRYVDEHSTDTSD